MVGVDSRGRARVPVLQGRVRGCRRDG